MMRLRTNIQSEAWAIITKEVERLPAELREKPIRAAMTKAARDIAAKQTAIVKAMTFKPLDKRQELRPRLYEIMGYRIRSYGKHLYTIAGATRGNKAGYHAHLVDSGHQIVVGGTLKDGGKKARTRKSKRGAAYMGRGIVKARVAARPFVKAPAVEVYSNFGDVVVQRVRGYIKNWESRVRRGITTKAQRVKV
jgi:hypothetical protein